MRLHEEGPAQHFYEHQVLPGCWAEVGWVRECQVVLRAAYSEELDGWKVVRRAEVEDPAKQCYGALLRGRLRGLIGTHGPELPFDLVADLRHAAAKALDLVRWFATAEFLLLAREEHMGSLRLSLSPPMLPCSALASPLPLAIARSTPRPPPRGKNPKTILGISGSQMEGNLEANKDKTTKWDPGAIFELGLSFTGGPDPPPP